MSGRDTEYIGYIDFFLIYLKNASGGRCVLCEKKFEADNLVFHHVYEITKVETISNLRRRRLKTGSRPLNVGQKQSEETRHNISLGLKRKWSMHACG